MAGDEIGFGGPPVSALVMLLVCLMVTMAYVRVPSRAQGAGDAGATEDGALVDVTDAAESATQGAHTRPNIVVIYLDDMRASDLEVMHNVRDLIAANGVTFTNSMVTTAACCPARATHLTGQYAHNTGVMHNSPPYGGYGAFKFGKQAAGESLPIWLERAGYRTAFFGKFMNHYPHPRDMYEIPPGFTDWYGLYEGTLRQAQYSIYRQTRYAVRARSSSGQPVLDSGRAREVVPVDQRDGGGQLLLYDGQDRHQTDVFMSGAVELIERDDGARPLYLNLWLTAPHSGGDGPVVGGKHYANRLRPLTVRPEQPELARLRSLLRRGQDLGELGLDRSASFNEDDVDDKPPFIRQKRKLSDEEIQSVEIRNALRRAALTSVDRRIADLLAAVRRAEQRTGRPSYVVFSSDGGFFLGEHRLPFEKNWHYGAATDVPLVISGPGVRRGVEVGVPVANIDLAPTLLHMAGGVDGITAPIDGRSLLPLLRDSRAVDDASWNERAVLLEGFWGTSRKRRYAGVRTRDFVYVEHYSQRDGTTLQFTELYDRRTDRTYRRNLLHGRMSSRSRAVRSRLDALLDRLRSCAGPPCHQRDRSAAIGTPQPTAPEDRAGRGQLRDDRRRAGGRDATGRGDSGGV